MACSIGPEIHCGTHWASDTMAFVATCMLIVGLRAENKRQDLGEGKEVVVGERAEVLDVEMRSGPRLTGCMKAWMLQGRQEGEER